MHPQKKRGFKQLACSCGEMVKVDMNSGGVTCASCVQKSVAPPDCYTPQKEKKEKEPQEIKEVEMITTGKYAGFPRCWHLKKEFIHPETGQKYCKGKLVENNLSTNDKE